MFRYVKQHISKCTKGLVGNKGVSLLELVVALAIVATLSGLLIPQFTRYITSKRATACEEHREAIISICEKLVYGRGISLDQLNGKPVFVPGDPTSVVEISTISSEDKEALKRHSECPDGGTIKLRVVGGVLQCYCEHADGTIHSVTHGDDNDEFVAVDLTTWSGNAIVSADPTFDTPSGYTYTPPTPEDEDVTESGGGDTPEDEDYPETYWPYPEDPYWTNVEYSADPAKEIPVPSGLFPVRTAGGSTVYLVAIRKNDGETTLRVTKNMAADPMNYLIGTGGTEAVIATNGLMYDSESIKKAVENNRSMWNDVDNDNNIEATDQYRISGGTIYKCPGSNKRYIYFHTGREWTTLPPEGFAGNKTGNWYWVGDADQIR